MAFNSDKERDEEIKRLEDATRAEIADLRRSADELEEELAKMVRERVMKHGRAA